MFEDLINQIRLAITLLIPISGRWGLRADKVMLRLEDLIESIKVVQQKQEMLIEEAVQERMKELGL